MNLYKKVGRSFQQAADTPSDDGPMFTNIGQCRRQIKKSQMPREAKNTCLLILEETEAVPRRLYDFDEPYGPDKVIMAPSCRLAFEMSWSGPDEIVFVHVDKNGSADFQHHVLDKGIVRIQDFLYDPKRDYCLDIIARLSS